MFKEHEKPRFPQNEEGARSEDSPEDLTSGPEANKQDAGLPELEDSKSRLREKIDELDAQRQSGEITEKEHTTKLSEVISREMGLLRNLSEEKRRKFFKELLAPEEKSAKEIIKELTNLNQEEEQTKEEVLIRPQFRNPKFLAESAGGRALLMQGTELKDLTFKDVVETEVSILEERLNENQAGSIQEYLTRTTDIDAQLQISDLGLKILGSPEGIKYLREQFE